MLMKQMQVNCVQSLIRRCLCSASEVRVRFAPSPTGSLHLGGLRTAFYNYLFAIQNKGTFILRIEDTDRERIIPGSVNALINILTWSGLVPHEGPTFGGEFGPYLQSERHEIYKEKALELIESGHAYRCFCSETRLNLIRKEALKNRQIPRYDNKCRNLTQKEINDKLNNNVSYTIRFKLKEGPLTFDDMVYGPTTIDLSVAEGGDPIIFKSDGFPTYHLANVVDDHLMKISHVLRGVEWQVSTPKHLMMFEAFQWQPPKYAHLPLIMNHDGTKLSKRQNDIQVEFYRNNGYYPEALINYLTNIGGGFGRFEDRIQTVEELASHFNIHSIKSYNCKLNHEKLKLYNRIAIYNKIDNNITQLINELKDKLTAKFGENIPLNVSDDYLKHIICWSKERIFTINDLVNNKGFDFLWNLPNLDSSLIKIANGNDLRTVLKEVSEAFKDDEASLETFNREIISQKIKSIFENKLGKIMKYNKIMKLLRISMTNLENGPPVAEIMEMLGKERTISYLSNAYKFVEKL